MKTPPKRPSPVVAERRYGELLKQLAKEPGKRTDQPPATTAGGSASAYREAIERDGISERA